MSGYHRTCHHVAYRLTCEDYDALWARAEGKCEICRITPEQTPTGLLAIDHDPRYGYFAPRGLLCPRCNSRIGANTKRAPTPEESGYLDNPWWLVLLQRRHAENVAASRRPRRQAKLVRGVERAALVAECWEQ